MSDHPHNPDELTHALCELTCELRLSREFRKTELEWLQAHFRAATHRDLEEMEKRIMASLEDLAADVTEEKTLIEGVSTLILGLKQQLADALAGTTLPPAVQAKVDKIFADAETNKAKLTEALTTNTEPTPPTTP